MNLLTKFREWANSLLPKSPAGTLTIWFNDGDVYRWTFKEGEFWTKIFEDWFNTSDSCDRISMKSGGGVNVMNFSRGDIRRYTIECDGSTPE